MLFESVAFAMGTAPQGATGGAGDYLHFIPLVLMLVIFWFFLIRPQKKRAKEHKDMLESLKRGDRVITSGGMIGRILEIDADTVLLECGESKVRLTRGAVGGMYNPTGKDSGKSAGKDAEQGAGKVSTEKKSG